MRAAWNTVFCIITYYFRDIRNFMFFTPVSSRLALLRRQGWRINAFVVPLLSGI
jgi:hypothetical protein